MSTTTLHRVRPAKPIRTKRLTAAPAIRVLHVINGEHYAGAERVQDYLALRLPAFGFDADFACIKPNRFGPLRQARQAVLHDVPMRSRHECRIPPASDGAAVIATQAVRMSKLMVLRLLMVNISLLEQIQSRHFFEARQRLFMIRNLLVVVELSVNDFLKIADHV